MLTAPSAYAYLWRSGSAQDRQISESRVARQPNAFGATFYTVSIHDQAEGAAYTQVSSFERLSLASLLYIEQITWEQPGLSNPGGCTRNLLASPGTKIPRS
jgi:hypothetical protein